MNSEMLLFFFNQPEFHVDLRISPRHNSNMSFYSIGHS